MALTKSGVIFILQMYASNFMLSCVLFLKMGNCLMCVCFPQDGLFFLSADFPVAWRNSLIYYSFNCSRDTINNSLGCQPVREHVNVFYSAYILLSVKFNLSNSIAALV